MNTEFRNETAADRDSIRKLNIAAFEGEAEADLVDALQDAGYVEVSLVAETENKIVGHILFSRMTIITDTGEIDALALAPMAVVPDFQRQGIGSKLVEAGLAAARNRGHRIVLVLGHPEFYPRFGFAAEHARQLKSPFGGGDAWMATELAPGALKGVKGQVEYPPPFGMFE